MSKSKIEWCTDTWNPIYGCTPISPGCENCYAKNWHDRFKDGDFSVIMKPEKLFEPLEAKKPKRYFVGSMTDIFHDEVSFWFLEKMFMIMALATQHTFMILTKRPERMREFISSFPILIYELKNPDGTTTGIQKTMLPLPNVWLGVTAENQEQADKRIPILLETPAAYRFVSVEPMLGPVLLEDFLPKIVEDDEGFVEEIIKGIDWVICGGESGHGARPLHSDWVRDLKEQCNGYGTPFFFKQWGEYRRESDLQKEYDGDWGQLRGVCVTTKDSKEVFYKVGKKVAGRLLDGEEVMEWPDALKPI